MVSIALSPLAIIALMAVWETILLMLFVGEPQAQHYGGNLIFGGRRWLIGVYFWLAPLLFVLVFCPFPKRPVSDTSADAVQVRFFGFCSAGAAAFFLAFMFSQR
jgi:hypothetical protein